MTHSAILHQIEEMIDRLSHKEQLLLIEELAHRLRKGPRRTVSPREAVNGRQLAAMAADAEIQTEIRRIAQEFEVTDTRVDSAEEVEPSYG